MTRFFGIEQIGDDSCSVDAGPEAQQPRVSPRLMTYLMRVCQEIRISAIAAQHGGRGTKSRAEPGAYRRSTERNLVDNAAAFLEYEVFHARVCAFLAGLAEQNHQDDPLDLIDVDIRRIERKQPVDEYFSLRG